MPTINAGACIVNGTPVDKVFSNGRQVYGRNLFRGYPTNNKMRVNKNNDYYFDYPFIKNGTRILLKPNTEYTVTWNYDIISGGINNTENISLGRGNKTTNFAVDMMSMPGKGTAMAPISAKRITIKTPADVSDNPYLALRFSRTNVPSSSVIDYWDIAIREGSVATPWTPAPEDVQA